MKSIQKIAIANRGEVACRIHRTCLKLGIKTVLLHSEPDVKTLAYRICDETYCIGLGSASESYLNIEAQISAAKKCGADAIHPGFGFLSENAEFAKKTIEAGLIFIGPSPECIEMFGDKIRAKALCKAAEIPMVPGFQSQSASLETLIIESEKIGYPVLVKAAAGGGGRGMRLILDQASAKQQIESAMNEALKAFGNETVFLEKFLDHAKHIEVQIFGDVNGHIYILGERECSVQRKHQKIIEETPSPSLSEPQRKEVFSYARKIGIQGHYQSAGTVEFMFQDQKFYFLEVNTRLQVEHTVTEEVLGIDLVEAQILTADSKLVQLPYNLSPKGHSVELRLYAEDPYQGGIPSTGTLGTLHLPLANGRRLEIGVEPKDEVTPFYDSMIGKMISTQRTRIEAINDLIEWINDSVVFGVQTNLPLLKKILNHPEFVIGDMSTNFFDTYFKNSLVYSTSKEDQDYIELELVKINELNKIQYIGHDSNKIKNSPWSQNWRNKELYAPLELNLSNLDFQQIGRSLWWKKNNEIFKFDSINRLVATSDIADGLIKSTMPGSIFKILCSPGQNVKAGQTLIIIEAMKMEHSIKADSRGVVKAVNFLEGDTVQDDDVLLELEPSKN